MFYIPSGPHPVMASGLGIKPAKHRQMGFPMSLIHMVPGPQGLGSQTSGFKTKKEKKKHLRLKKVFFFSIFVIVHEIQQPIPNSKCSCHKFSGTKDRGVSKGG